MEQGLKIFPFSYSSKGCTSELPIGQNSRVLEPELAEKEAKQEVDGSWSRGKLGRGILEGEAFQRLLSDCTEHFHFKESCFCFAAFWSERQ